MGNAAENGQSIIATWAPAPIRPSPIQFRLEGEGWEGEEGRIRVPACSISHSFLFLLLPTHEGVSTFTGYWGGLWGRVQGTVVIRSLEHRAEVTHEGNEELRLQRCPNSGKGGLRNKLRLRRQR